MHNLYIWPALLSSLDPRPSFTPLRPLISILTHLQLPKFLRCRFCKFLGLHIEPVYIAGIVVAAVSGLGIAV